MSATVRFADTLETLQAQGITATIEIGPDAVLTALAARQFDDITAIALQRRTHTETTALLTGLGTAHSHGVTVEWENLLTPTETVELPTYPFQHERFWIDAMDYWRGPWAGAGDYDATSASPSVPLESVPEFGLRFEVIGLDDIERDRALLAAVREQVALVLGHSSTEQVEADRAFSELGFDSMAAVQLHKRLVRTTGLELPATLIFDYPTARDVAGYLGVLLEQDTAADEPVTAELDRLEMLLAEADPSSSVRSRVTARLEAMLRAWTDPDAEDAELADLVSASDDELFAVLDGELGIS